MSTADDATNKKPGPVLIGCLRTFFGAMLLFATLMLWGTLIVPGIQVLRARSWEPVRCTVEESKLQEEPGDESVLYTVAVRYTYRYAGRTYTSSRFNFSNVKSSSGRREKEAAVRQLIPGGEATCYVNPSRPEQTVIDRSFQNESWWALATLPFFAVGLLVFLPTRAFGKRGAAAGPVDPSWRMSKTGLPEDAFALAGRGPVELRARVTRRKRLTQSILFFVFCVGALAAVGLAVKSAEAHGRPAGPLPAVFMFVGFLTLLAAWTLVESVWGAVRPNVRLAMSPGAPRLGEILDLRWVLEGSAAKVVRLRLRVEGQEIATYTRGTDTTTDRRTFFEKVVVDTKEPARISNGAADFIIPDDLMHTFQGKSNQVAWTLHLVGEIPSEHGIKEEFPLMVLPAEARTNAEAAI